MSPISKCSNDKPNALLANQLLWVYPGHIILDKATQCHTQEHVTQTLAHQVHVTQGMTHQVHVTQGMTHQVHVTQWHVT
jgi:hypothetical protein